MGQTVFCQLGGKDSKEANLQRELEQRGYKLVYVLHEVIKDYIACYRVEYEGKVIYPPAADKLGFPLNEIWISEAFRPYEKYILYHELREIFLQARGYSVQKVHRLAEQDEEKFWRENPGWEELKLEINVAPEEALVGVPGIGKTLARRICECRPYWSMDDLHRVPYVGKVRLERLKERFWCICEGKQKARLLFERKKSKSGSTIGFYI